jgi:hypothetical protein
MANIGSVTRQLAGMDINASKKQPTASGSRPGHLKQASSSNLSKLLSKNTGSNPPIQPLTKSKSTTSVRNPEQQQRPAPPSGGTTRPALDIGNYDGGLEIENEKRGEPVFGQAAQELALDSSVS